MLKSIVFLLAVVALASADENEFITEILGEHPCLNKLVDQRLPHPTNPNKFLRCVASDTVWVEECPDLLVFNAESETCDWDERSRTEAERPKSKFVLMNKEIRKPVLFKTKKDFTRFNRNHFNMRSGDLTIEQQQQQKGHFVRQDVELQQQKIREEKQLKEQIARLQALVGESERRPEPKVSNFFEREFTPVEKKMSSDMMVQRKQQLDRELIHQRLREQRRILNEQRRDQQVREQRELLDQVKVLQRLLKENKNRPPQQIRTVFTPQVQEVTEVQRFEVTRPQTSITPRERNLLREQILKQKQVEQQKRMNDQTMIDQQVQQQRTLISQRAREQSELQMQIQKLNQLVQNSKRF